MHVYCDSAIIIYYLDHTGEFQLRTAKRLATLQAAGDQLAVSDLTRLECRVGPMRSNDTLTLAKFDGFFALRDVLMVPLTTAVYDRATEIRARHGLKTLDAIHLAAAMESHCQVFLTNDLRLSAFPGLRVEVLA